MDMSCCIFFKISRLTEPIHLGLLIPHLLLQVEEHLVELLTGVLGIGSAASALRGMAGEEWKSSSSWIWTLDRLIYRSTSSRISIAFSLPVGAVGAAAITWATFFLGGSISVV